MRNRGRGHLDCRLLRQARDSKQYREPILVICYTNHALDQVLEDLLEYLADVVRHFEPAFGRNSKGKLVLPYLTHPSRLHCTMQGDWQQMRRTLLSGLD